MAAPWGSHFPCMCNNAMKKGCVLKPRTCIHFSCSCTKHKDHITPILRELKWMTVDQTLVYKDIVQTYKCMNDLSPPYLSEKFYLRDTIHNYSTRSSKDLEIPKSNTNYGQKTFHYRATKHWNSLPDSIKSLRNIKHFKSEVKKHILNN